MQKTCLVTANIQNALRLGRKLTALPLREYSDARNRGVTNNLKRSGESLGAPVQLEGCPVERFTEDVFGVDHRQLGIAKGCVGRAPGGNLAVHLVHDLRRGRVADFPQ